MRAHIKIILVVILIIVGLFVVLHFIGGSFVSSLSPSLEVQPQQQVSESSKAHVGEKVPYFSLTPLTGEKIDLASLSGDGIILIFWSTWNAQSVDQIKIVDDYIGLHNREMQDSHVHIIAINSQERRGVVANFMRRGGYNVETLLDENGETSGAYGVQTLPTTFFINQSGTLVDSVVGTMSDRTLGDKMEQVLRSD